jgi:hypothetical protein
MFLDIIFVIVFALFFIMLVIVGAVSFFLPHKVIDFNLRFSNRINFLRVKPPLDPHGATMVGYYRMVGFLMLSLVGCPLILIITLTLKVAIGGGDICVGDNTYCITF